MGACVASVALAAASPHEFATVLAASYSSTVLADAPVAYWRLGESAGTAMVDSTANANSGTYQGGYTLGQPGAIAGDSDTAVTFGGQNGYAVAPSFVHS